MHSGQRGLSSPPPPATPLYQDLVLIAAATPNSSKEADLPFGRMGTVGLEPVYGIYPVQPVGAFSCRRTRQSLGDSYVYKVSNIIMHTHTERLYI